MYAATFLRKHDGGFPVTVLPLLAATVENLRGFLLTAGKAARELACRALTQTEYGRLRGSALSSRNSERFPLAVQGGARRWAIAFQPTSPSFWLLTHSKQCEIHCCRPVAEKRTFGLLDVGKVT